LDKYIKLIVTFLVVALINIEYIDSKKNNETTYLILTLDAGPPCIVPMKKSEVKDADIDKLIKEYCVSGVIGN
jgi:hypothetical protein